MSKKKPPTTIEECNAEMELTQKKIRQYENRNKMLDRKLAIDGLFDGAYNRIVSNLLKLSSKYDIIFFFSEFQIAFS